MADPKKKTDLSPEQEALAAKYQREFEAEEAQRENMKSAGVDPDEEKRQAAARQADDERRARAAAQAAKQEAEDRAYLRKQDEKALGVGRSPIFKGQRDKIIARNKTETADEAHVRAEKYYGRETAIREARDTGDLVGNKLLQDQDATVQKHLENWSLEDNETVAKARLAYANAVGHGVTKDGAGRQMKTFQREDGAAHKIDSDREWVQPTIESAKRLARERVKEVTDKALQKVAVARGKK